MTPDQRPQRWQRLVHKIAASRAGAWLFAHTLHYVDRPLLRLSKQRLSLAGLLAGLPIVMLTTIGAKSGKQRNTPLVGIREGDAVILIASYFGNAHHPAWYYNLRAHPQVTLSIRGQSATSYIAREATDTEREIYWRRAVELYAGYAAYKRRVRGREIPIVILMRAAISNV